MSQNNAIYKGFKVSAMVRRLPEDAPGANPAKPVFLATATITQVSSGSGSLRQVPPLLQHFGFTPHAAIDEALTSARTAIDGMSTFIKRK